MIWFVFGIGMIAGIATCLVGIIVGLWWLGRG